jgi:hypothetical protein
MVVIRGRVDPERTPNGTGHWRHLLGLGRWHLEYTAKDGTGRTVRKGAFKADLNGHFVLAVDAPVSGTVEIRVKGRVAEARDSCTIKVITADDVLNLPRTLYPCNGHTRSVSRAA